MIWPRFGTSKWKDCMGREWTAAGHLSEWESLDNFVGIPYYVLDRSGSFLEWDSLIEISSGCNSKTLRVLNLLDVSSNGFKSLYLVSEL